MYSVSGYREMIADRIRSAAYLESLRQTVRADSIVVEIGSGLGLFAIEAARLGARQVFAIEPANVIQISREIARVAGVADRITFIQELSTAVELPERADVIVSDLRGLLPLFQQLIPSIIDARERLLKPGGVLIPDIDTLWAGPVEDPDQYRRVSSWDDLAEGVDFASARRVVANTWWKGRVRPESFLSTPQSWATLDYKKITEPDVQGKLEFVVNRNAQMHGWALWFDTNLHGKVGFSNHAALPELIYGNAFFPLIAPVDLMEGDRITFRFRADLVDDDYVFCWDTQIVGPDCENKADYRQSSFFGNPISATQLIKQASNFVPALSEVGKVDRRILELMDSHRTIEEIAAIVFAEFPTTMVTKQKARNQVSKLSREYAR